MSLGDRARRICLLLALNTGLATLVHLSAPPAPAHSDRQEYEYVGSHPLEPDCPWSIYCYRVLVPVLLEQLPMETDGRWRAYQVVSVATAGTLTSVLTSSVTGNVYAGVLAAILVQSAYGFSFTAYDPFSADPLVFVFASLIAWCWVADRWRPALTAGLVGIFAKETVMLVSGACALAALNKRRGAWMQWCASAAVVTLTLFTFRGVMDTYFGWSASGSAAAQWAEGAWLAIWWENNPFLIRKLYLLFAPFGFAWLFAVLGYRTADERLRSLARGVVLPFLALCYVQTPERALSNTFFIVVPLAAIYLSEGPVPLTMATAIANALVTAKVGSSTEWLPSSGLMMIPACLLTAYLLWVRRR